MVQQKILVFLNQGQAGVFLMADQLLYNAAETLNYLMFGLPESALI
jgi:hypothetical protein